MNRSDRMARQRPEGTWANWCVLLLVAVSACGADTERRAVQTDTSHSPTPMPAVAAPVVLPTPDTRLDTNRVGVHVPEEFPDMGAPVSQYMSSAYFRDSTASLALFHVALSGTRQEVWLLEHLPRTRSGEPTGWTVLTTVTPPDTLNSDLRIWLGCARGGKPNPRLISVVHYEDLTTLTHIERAWEVDQSRRIVVVPTAGITCHNEIVLD